MWLAGYRRTVEGSSFPYHAFAPELRSALLVRANDERPAVTWETAPVSREAIEDGWVHFVWVFAMDASSDPAPFTLHLDDEPLLGFESRKAADLASWQVEGDGGATLRFRPVRLDRHGDPMGYAFLRVPASRLTPGRAARLRLASEDRGQTTWTMVYEHEVRETVEVDPLPRIRRGEGEAVQWVRLRLTHLGNPAAVSVRHEGREVARAALPFGRSSLDVPVPAATAPRETSLEVAIDDRATQEVRFTQHPVKRWTVHLVQHTHTDIGYTRPQTEILPDHLRFIDYALDFCDATDDRPDDARFRWTCEASWPVREYLRSRPAAQVERLRRRVTEGRIELTALMFNLSEIPDESSLLSLLEPLREIQAAGFAIRSAMQNDVNGLAWSLAEALPSVGVESFVMGQHSHRALPCFDRPTAFWWESPAGTRLLGYRGDHYMTGNEWGLHGVDDEAFADGLFHHLEHLEGSGYPFDRASIQYGGYLTDNAPPSLFGPAMIDRWNETWAWPRLRSSTSSEFLDWIRGEHGPELPVHRGAWPDWWTDGFGSAARETAAARRTQGELIAVQALAVFAQWKGAGLPLDWGERVETAYESLLFFDEHTLGAAESISDPGGRNTQIQWAQKAAYVWDAVKRTRVLQEAAHGFARPALPRSRDAQVVVFNPLAWARDGVAEVYIDHQLMPPDGSRVFADPRGLPVAAQAMAQRSDGTTWAIGVPGVPALGHLALRIVEGEAEPVGPPPAMRLENAWYELEVDPRTGSVARLRDKDLGVDLVDPEAAWGFLAPIYERLANRHQLEARRLDAYERHPLEDVRVEAGPAGPLYESLVVRGTLPGGSEPGGLRIELRLLRAVKRVQVACTIRKLRVTDPEGLYVAFPFRLPEGTIHFDVPGGDVVPGRDQLPGSVSDWNTAQRYVRVVGDAAEVVIASDEIPLWQLGGLNLGRFRDVAVPATAHVYSWVMNNYWVTNFCASQEGEFRWHYDLTSHAPDRPHRAARFGWETRVPLLARVFPPSAVDAGSPFASLLAAEFPPALLVVGIRPSTDKKAAFVHLQEVDGEPASIDVLQLFAGARAVHRVDALGREPLAIHGPVAFEPHGVRFLRIDF